MITASNANNTSPYVDNCIVYAISLMSSLSRSNISSLVSALIQYQAGLISSISLYNSNIRILLNNIAKTEIDIYSENMISGMEKIRNIQNNVLLIDVLQPLIYAIRTSLETTKTYIESENGLESGSLPLYSLDADRTLLKTSSLSKYKNCKEVFMKVSDVLSYLSNEMDNSVSQERSEGYSFVDKVIARLESITSNVKKQIADIDRVEILIDSCKIVEYTFLEYNFVTQDEIDSFLNQNYSIIKERMLLAITNQI